MKILVKFPTRNRKTKFFNVLKIYQTLANNLDNMLFLITIDEDDIEMNNSDCLEILSTFKNCKVVVDYSSSKVHAVNRDMNYAKDWDILLLASDDMIPQIKGYDEIIINKMKDIYPNTDGVLWFNDGFKKSELNTICILGKRYYEKFNYIYYPGYKSTWCDNEFMTVADLLGKQTYFDDVIIKHEHPDWGFGKQDEVHKKNQQDFNYDMTLYNNRKKINFEL
jgi:hypothetical protein